MFCHLSKVLMKIWTEFPGVFSGGRLTEGMNGRDQNHTSCFLMNSSCFHDDTSNKTLQFSLSAPAIVAACFISLIIITVIFGNLLVILSILKDRQLKRVIQNRFNLSLAVADFLLGLLIMPLSLYLEIVGYWGLNRKLCDTWLAMDVLLCTASTLSLVVVSLDRYFSVTKPFEYTGGRTAKRVNIAILGIWLTSGIVSLPPLAGWKSNTPPLLSSSFQQCHLTDALSYVAYSLTMSFYIPLAIILIAYCRICLVTRR